MRPCGVWYLVSNDDQEEIHLTQAEKGIFCFLFIASAIAMHCYRDGGILKYRGGEGGGLIR